MLPAASEVAFDPMDPRDEDPTTQILATAELPTAFSTGVTLAVVEGPDFGKTFRIEDLAHRRVLIGKSPACEVLLTDRTASRRHAALESDGTVVRIVDLGSSNGTRVGGLRVMDAFLSHGDVIRIGATALRFDVDERAHELPASGDVRFHKVLGASVAMRRLYPVFERLAAAQVPVLIEGETGTGKEVLAEALHEASPRKGAPFVIFDCTTVSASLVEAELFGHEKGAFTGAVASRAGVFEQAHRGTIFIDEIGDLELALQAKLLRALERSEVRRVGGNQWTKVDVRVIAATRRELDREVQAGRFRDDLFYRLAVARVELPPLRKRLGDVSLLANCFWKLLGGSDLMSPEVLSRFESYDWPGNVRELYNAVARQLALGEVSLGRAAASPWAADGGRDFLDHLVDQGLPFPRGRQEAILEFERRFVKKMLDVHDGDVARAAAASGIGRRYFQKLKTKV